MAPELKTHNCPSCGGMELEEVKRCSDCGCPMELLLEQPLDSVEEIQRCFTYQKPDQEQVFDFAMVHEKLVELGKQILACCPKSGDRDRAFESLRQCRMWANSSIAHRGRY